MIGSNQQYPTYASGSEQTNLSEWANSQERWGFEYASALSDERGWPLGRTWIQLLDAGVCVSRDEGKLVVTEVGFRFEAEEDAHRQGWRLQIRQRKSAGTLPKQAERALSSDAAWSWSLMDD